MDKPDYAKIATSRQAEWLEDVLAGLLVAGCSKDEIEVQRFNDDPLRVVVAVRGVPKYEHRINWKLSPRRAERTAP